MTRKKRSKDTLVMPSPKKGYSLISNRELLSLHLTIDCLADFLSQELKGDKKDVVYFSRKKSWEFIDEQDDQVIQEKADEIIKHFDELEEEEGK